MRSWIAYSIILISAVFLLSACQPQSKPIHIQTDAHKIPFSVEIADEPKELARGLMFREDLEKNQGMLFVFPEQAMRSFWMKNTPLPLDMLFIDKNFKIVHIHPMAKPYDTTPISSRKPAMYVLEILGGQAATHGINIGDTLIYQE